MAEYLNETEATISCPGAQVAPGETYTPVPDVYLPDPDDNGLTLVRESPTPHRVEVIQHDELPGTLSQLKSYDLLIIKNLTNANVTVNCNGNNQENGWPLVSNEAWAIKQKYEIDKIRLSGSPTSGAIYVLCKYNR